MTNCPDCAVRAGIQVRSNLPEHRHRVPLFLHGSCGSLVRMDEKHVRPAPMHDLPRKRNLLPTGAMHGKRPEVSAGRKKSALSTVSSTYGHRCRPGVALQKNHRKPCL